METFVDVDNQRYNSGLYVAMTIDVVITPTKKTVVVNKYYNRFLNKEISSLYFCTLISKLIVPATPDTMLLILISPFFPLPFKKAYTLPDSTAIN